MVMNLMTLCTSENLGEIKLVDIDKLNEASRIARIASTHKSQAAELAKSVDRDLKKLSKTTESFLCFGTGRYCIRACKIG